MDKVNKQELRRLAEAQPIKVWRRDDGRLPFKPSVERMFFVEGPDVVSDYEEVGFSRSAASFIAAANPAAILSLLDELERVEGELSACTEYPGGCGYWREAARHRQAELEQYRKDALRYRWLRDQHNDEHSDTGVFDAIGVVLSADGELDLDAWADAEMAKEGGANG